ncbi:MAG: hypothetical protein M3275_07775 [Thermoproteota archaeon]|nr:hypothetical protein [Thermoproteota archaeon]
MIPRKTRARPSKKFTHELADDNKNKEKLKVIEDTHSRDDYTDYDYDDNNIHTLQSKSKG